MTTYNLNNLPDGYTDFVSNLGVTDGTAAARQLILDSINEKLERLYGARLILENVRGLVHVGVEDKYLEGYLEIVADGNVQTNWDVGTSEMAQELLGTIR